MTPRARRYAAPLIGGAVGSARHQPLVNGDALFKIVVKRDLAAVHHDRHVAVAPQRREAVRDHDDARVDQPLLEGEPAFLLEAVIADLGDLVDEIPVERHRHADPESEPGPHAGGIGRDRHLEKRAEFGEIAHEFEHPIGILPVDPRREARVIGARCAAIEAAGETKRPRHAALADDASAVGGLATGDQAQQCRFAGAVLADDRDVAVSERQRDGAEDVLASTAELVGFGDIDEPDHVRPPRAAESAPLRARSTSSPVPSRSGIRS